MGDFLVFLAFYPQIAMLQSVLKSNEEIADPLDPRSLPIERRTPRLAHVRHAAPSRHVSLGAD